MTTETDRELLELAAKAYGLATEYVWHSDPFYEGFMRRNFDESGFEIETQLWNPRDDDGDALRLAVKLGLFAEYDAASQLQAISEVPGADPYADTRRAIVRAAAEIGRVMK